MALRAFHDNPGIGGFGESTLPLSQDRNSSTQRSDRSSFSTIIRERSNFHAASRKDQGGSRERTPPPSSGGDGDLLCQIVKELVDNAVDACRNPSRQCRVGEAESNNNNNNNNNGNNNGNKGNNGNNHKTATDAKGTNRKRIRVDIRPSSETGHPHEDLLQVTVTDNGCGMENIERCVTAFHSSKATTAKGNSDSNNDSNDNDNGNGNGNGIHHTSGRYGMGLTLCLLHGQRCVPNSRACISSATPNSKHRKRAFFRVNREGDSVDCIRQEVTPNDSGGHHASGTCVSLLVPGGGGTKLAWPRLHDYFTRFRLCTDLHFELDVFAPTLSKVPIFVRPCIANAAPIGDATLAGTSPEKELRNTGSCTKGSEDPWEELMDDDVAESDNDNNNDNDNDKSDKQNNPIKSRQSSRGDATTTAPGGNTDPDRLAFFRAARSFWPKRNVRYPNVARSVRNIRIGTPGTNGRAAGRKGAGNAPELQMEVGIVICPRFPREESQARFAAESAPDTPSCDQGETDGIGIGIGIDSGVDDSSEPTASLQLVRMVNGVPILDSAEAHSCGLVHGLANKIVWGSFGLDVERNPIVVAPETETETATCNPSSHTPRFRVRDSHLIVPFLRHNSNHKQLKCRPRETTDAHGTKGLSAKNKRRVEAMSRTDLLLPANVRIGNILVLVHIRAAPSSLPLPTLSKGRLPLHHRPIDSTLQLGLRDCLSSLQSTNPSLLLTTAQLRAAEREVRYIPGIACAVSRIVCGSNNAVLRRQSLRILRTAPESSGKSAPLGSDGLVLEASALAIALESRLRLAMKVRSEAANARKRSKKQNAVVARDEKGDPEEGFRDFDSEEESLDATKCSRADRPGSIPQSSSSSSTQYQNRILETDSEVSLQSVASPPGHALESNGKREQSDLPLREIVIGNRCNTGARDREETESDFDDWW